MTSDVDASASAELAMRRDVPRRVGFITSKVAVVGGCEIDYVVRIAERANPKSQLCQVCIFHRRTFKSTTSRSMLSVHQPPGRLGKTTSFGDAACGGGASEI